MNLLFENIRLALGNLELSLDCTLSGKITALFGPTGSGKTSIIEVIAGLRRPRCGKILLGERVLQDSDSKIFLPARKRRMGYVPQDLALFPHLTVTQNLNYGQNRNWKSPFNLSRVTEILEISPLLSRRPETLSGGEKQRVAFARALFAQPDILLLDEPLSSLDDSLKQRIIPQILAIRDELKIPIIYVSHSCEEIMALCDHAVILEKGTVMAQGSPADLFVRTERAVYLPRQFNFSDRK